MSRPPATGWQVAGFEKPAKAQVAGITAATRGAIPWAPKMRAAILPGRADITVSLNCEVSMNALTVSVLLLRKPSLTEPFSG